MGDKDSRSRKPVEGQPQQAAPAQPGITGQAEALERLRAKFDRPSAEYRSAPFWGWNDKLDPEELVRQIDGMKEQGMGGFFMHSRDGLETEYMGPEWMEAVKASVKRAEEVGLLAWMYDEDRWPSGNVGGKVPALGDEYRSKGLTIEVVSGPYITDGREVALFRAEVDDMSLAHCERLPLDGEPGRRWELESAGAGRADRGSSEPEGEEAVSAKRGAEARAAVDWAEEAVQWAPHSQHSAPSGQHSHSQPPGQQQGQRPVSEEGFSQPAKGEVFLAFRIEVSEAVEWFNDEAPPDSLNPATVRQFIDRTHEVYKREVGEHFGRTIRGIFTDEPSINDRHCKYTAGRGWVPWTYDFASYFSSRRGYDILDAAPHLFFNSSESPAARHDYWRTVAEKFCEAFTKQLYDWCEDNQLALTGHYLQEDKLGLGTRVGGALMPHYRYQHIPGIDLLTEQTDEYMTVKQCTSVANQYGREKVISETYGCTGWEFTFEGQKWLGDWQYVLGVNFLSQHLALYSIKGCRKRDYPPVFNYNTSWWKYDHVMEDYFARIGAVLSEGEPVRDLLVLHPASTAWSLLGSNPYGLPNRGRDRDIPGINRYGDEFNAFLKALFGAHHDLDLGDETIMAETGSVQDGRLVVNRSRYKTVVLPPVHTLLRSTVELLEQFMAAGGRIIGVQPLPSMIEGRSAAEELRQRLFQHPGFIPARHPGEAIARLEEVLPRNISIRSEYGTEAPELLYMLRRLEGGSILFIVNNDRYRSVPASIELPGDIGRVEEWNALTGERKEIEAWLEEGRGLRLDVRFGPADSKLFFINSTLPPQASGKTVEPVVFHDEDLYAAFGPAFRFRRTMPNVLTLDQCFYQLEDEAWSEKLEVWQAQRRIRESLGMRQVYYNGITQRYKWASRPHPNDGAPVTLRFEFEVSEIPAQGLSLVLEGAKQFDIRLNRSAVENRADRWFLDRTFDCIRLESGFLRQGMNEIELSCAYTNAMELEDIYLIGEFGVSPDRRIVSEPQRLHVGDWCLQGYYHYCGSMIYEADYEHPPEPGVRAVLELGDFSAVTVEVRINGMPAGQIPWKAADGLDVTSYLQAGRNKLEIEVMGSPRNMFGPFHQARGATATTNWGSFRTEGREYCAEYVVKPYGLNQQVKLLRKV
ncbi:glycosyl hydrolase [Paenibacillus sp. y28]|uniref:glycosyl hydrolase n=1 Tax=Paenibacillus sp. y28 TaxID=3129110 RepID=UPI0030184154